MSGIYLTWARSESAYMYSLTPTAVRGTEGSKAVPQLGGRLIQQ